MLCLEGLPVLREVHHFPKGCRLAELRNLPRNPVSHLKHGGPCGMTDKVSLGLECDTLVTEVLLVYASD